MGLLSMYAIPHLMSMLQVHYLHVTKGSLLSLRSHPKVARLPPYLSLLCILAGVAWLCLLPLDEYSRRTYVSENAILPGQVHTYFGGSEHDVFRAFRHEVAGLAEQSPET